MPKQDQIKGMSAGAYFTAIIEKKKYTTQPDADTRTLIKKEIAAYNIKNSAARLAKIKKLLAPKAEKAKTELVVAKKKIKREKKELKQEIKEIAASVEVKEKVADLIESVIESKTETKVEEVVKVATEVKSAPVYSGHRRSGEH